LARLTEHASSYWCYEYLLFIIVLNSIGQIFTQEEIEKVINLPYSHSKTEVEGIFEKVRTSTVGNKTKEYFKEKDETKEK